MNKTEGIDNRNHYRVEKPLVVSLNYPSGNGWKSVFGACYNLSEDGALLKINLPDDSKYIVNDNLNLTLFLSEWEDKIDILAKIVHISTNTGPSRLSEIGVNFIYISGKDQNSISDFVFKTFLKKIIPQ